MKFIMSIIYAICLKLGNAHLCWKIYWKYGSDVKSHGIEIWKKYLGGK